MFVHLVVLRSFRISAAHTPCRDARQRECDEKLRKVYGDIMLLAVSPERDAASCAVVPPPGKDAGPLSHIVEIH